MDSIRIDTGVKRLLINDGPDVLEFNPTDVVFAEKFYAMIREFEEKQAEYQARAELAAADEGVDENGIPVNIEKSLALLREVCVFLRERIDFLFGPGTSQKLFGDAMTLDMFEQFFKAIAPHIQRARADKVSRYAKAEKRGGRKVMK